MRFHLIDVWIFYFNNDYVYLCVVSLLVHTCKNNNDDDEQLHFSSLSFGGYSRTWQLKTRQQIFKKEKEKETKYLNFPFLTPLSSSYHCTPKAPHLSALPKLSTWTFRFWHLWVPLIIALLNLLTSPHSPNYGDPKCWNPNQSLELLKFSLVLKLWQWRWVEKEVGIMKEVGRLVRGRVVGRLEGEVGSSQKKLRVRGEAKKNMIKNKMSPGKKNVKEKKRPGRKKKL